MERVAELRAIKIGQVQLSRGGLLFCASALAIGCGNASPSGVGESKSAVLWGDKVEGHSYRINTDEYVGAKTDQQLDWGTAVGVMMDDRYWPPIERGLVRNVLGQTCTSGSPDENLDCTAEIHPATNNLCINEGETPSNTKFADQSMIDLGCTATMIRQNVFVTAAHCVNPTKPEVTGDRLECYNRAVVMRWRTNEGQEDANHFVLEQHIYSCDDVIRGTTQIDKDDLVSPTRDDWAIFTVDREVTGGGPTGGPVTPDVREPLLLDPRPVTAGPREGGATCNAGDTSCPPVASVTDCSDIECPKIFHHPLGLPLKFDDHLVIADVGSTVVHVGPDVGGPGTFWVEGNLEAGSSGGALLSSKGRILGTVSSGPINPMSDMGTPGDKTDDCMRLCRGPEGNGPNGADLDPACVNVANRSDKRAASRTVFVQASNLPEAFHPAFGNFDGDALEDAAVFNVSGGKMVIDVRFGDGVTETVPTEIDDLGLSTEPRVKKGNVDGDSKDEIIVKIAGQLFNIYEAAPSREAPQRFQAAAVQMGLVPIDEENLYASIDVADFDQDGFDDLEGVRMDGTVVIFPGGSGGLGAPVVQSGLPTANGEDGKLLLLSGKGLDTVAANEARLKISVGEDDEAALDALQVSIFDGDNSGLHQFDRELHGLKTCYTLTTDPCGDGGVGNCLATPRETVDVVSLDDSEFQDDAWGLLYDGPHVNAASLAGNGLPPFTYQLRVHFAADCDLTPPPESQIDFAIADGFKVRSNGLVSHVVGELSLIGSDSLGDWGAGEQPYLKDTDYDGNFDLSFWVGSGGSEIQLKEADADDIDDTSDPGVSDGANSEIAYQLLQPNDGGPALLTSEDEPAGTSDVSNPSGNNDGSPSANDVETRIHADAPLQTGAWTWRWTGVGAGNAIHVFAPFGSPTTYELMGERKQRKAPTHVKPPSYWVQAPEALTTALPIVLGRTENGVALGAARTVSSEEEALALLVSDDSSQTSVLQRELLTLKLNRSLAATAGEDLDAALVYGATVSVRTLQQKADQVLTGSVELPSTEEQQRLIRLLGAVNQGEVNYQQPGVPFPEQPLVDDDGDGIANLKDNCPGVANFDQIDSDADRVGDACAVAPLSHCVLQRSADVYEAFIGYDNPLSFRSIPVGLRNRFLGKQADRGQPTEFGAGLTQDAFSVRMREGESLTWELEGESLAIATSGDQCSGAELFQVDGTDEVAIFGSSGVVVGEDVDIEAKAGGRGAVYSAGSLEVGARARLQSVLAAQQLLLGENTFVRGRALAGELIVTDSTARIDGERLEHRFLPKHDISWVVEPSTSEQDVRVSAGQHRKLAPGSYAKIVVEPGGVLELKGGQYRAAAFVVGERAEVMIAEGAQAWLRVSDELTTQGTVLDGLTLSYFGNEDALIAGRFEGRALAPNSRLVLGGDTRSELTGAFFALYVEVRPGTVVRYR